MLGIHPATELPLMALSLLLGSISSELFGFVPFGFTGLGSLKGEGVAVFSSGVWVSCGVLSEATEEWVDKILKQG